MDRRANRPFVVFFLRERLKEASNIPRVQGRGVLIQVRAGGGMGRSSPVGRRTAKRLLAEGVGLDPVAGLFKLFQQAFVAGQVQGPDQYQLDILVIKQPFDHG